MAACKCGLFQRFVHIWCVIILVLMCLPRHGTFPTADRENVLSKLKKGCAGCNLQSPFPSTPTAQQRAERLQKLEFAKSDLLQKLHLSERPRASVKRVRIPQAVVSEFLRESQEEENRVEEKRDDILILGQPSKFGSCDERSACVSFTYNHASPDSIITPRTLWVYIKDDMIEADPASRTYLTVNSIADDTQLTVLLTSKLRKSHGGWHAVSISNASPWMNSSVPTALRDQLHVRISCSNCTVSSAPRFQPFLVVEKKPMPHHRSRRSAGCKNSDGCCLDSFVVDMKEIGWSDWIMVPQHYDAKFCRGSCANVTETREHTAFIQGVARKTQRHIKKCCTATEFKPLSILYMNDDNVLVKTVIRNLIATKCECS